MGANSCGPNKAYHIVALQVREGVVTKSEAVSRLVAPAHLDELLQPSFSTTARAAASPSLARGLGASPGAAVGLAALDPELAEAWARQGKPVILIRSQTNVADVQAMRVVNGMGNREPCRGAGGGGG